MEEGDRMPRPRCLRRIYCLPGVTYFKPAGIPLRVLEEVVVTLDEVESIRLADLEGRYQEQAAERMKISRPTFSRLIESAHRKVAEALVHGKALRLEGGPIQVKGGLTMPQRDGTGPARAVRGLGRGLCGWGRRRGFGRRRGAGLSGAPFRSRDLGEAKPPPPDEAAGESQTRNNEKGE